MPQKTHRTIHDKVLDLKQPAWYGGIPTFLGAPFAQTASDLKDTDIAYVGLPWQSPSPDSRMGPAGEIFSGAALTPQAMRVNSIKYAGYLPELDIDLFDHLAFTDYGNADIGADLRAGMESATRKVCDVLEAGAIPVTVGGMAGLGCLPAIYAISRNARGPIAILNFDAHGDNRGYGDYDGLDQQKPTIGAEWALRIFDLPHVSPQHYHHIGLRGSRNDAGTIPRFLDCGVPRENIYTYRDIKSARKKDFDAFALDVARIALDGAEHLWIAFDADVLDLSVCPGFGDEPLGINVDELVEMCYQAGKAAGRSRLAGISFMAIPPKAIEMQWISVYALLYTLAGMLQIDQQP
jgi:arginase family enzyme